MVDHGLPACARLADCLIQLALRRRLGDHGCDDREGLDLRFETGRPCEHVAVLIILFIL